MVVTKITGAMEMDIVRRVYNGEMQITIAKEINASASLVGNHIRKFTCSLYILWLKGKTYKELADLYQLPVAQVRYRLQKLHYKLYMK